MLLRIEPLATTSNAILSTLGTLLFLGVIIYLCTIKIPTWQKVIIGIVGFFVVLLLGFLAYVNWVESFGIVYAD